MSILAVNVLVVNHPFPRYVVSKNIFYILCSVNIVLFFLRSILDTLFRMPFEVRRCGSSTARSSRSGAPRGDERAKRASRSEIAFGTRRVL